MLCPMERGVTHSIWEPITGQSLYIHINTYKHTSVSHDAPKAARAAAEAAVPQEGLAALPPPPKPVMSLELAQDITSQMLTPAVEFGPPVPFSTVLLQKGAVASFAAWQTKYPAIIGLLLGKVQKGRVECWKIVTSTSDSLLSLMQHKKIRRVCRESSINTIGMIQGPELDRERTLENLKILEQDSISCPTCVFVTWRMLYIYIYTYKCEEGHAEELTRNIRKWTGAALFWKFIKSASEKCFS